MQAKGGKGKARAVPEEVDEETLERRREANRARMLAQHAVEAAHARVNGPTVAAEWRQRLRLAKLGELRSAAAVLHAGHEHQMQRHAAIIQALRQDVDAAEATTAAAAVEHAAALGSLAAMHDARLDAVRLQTDAQLASLLDAFASEDVELVETHERQVAELEASLAEVSAAAAAAEAEDWEAQQAAVDRLNEHDMEEYHVMKILLGNKLEAMEQQFEDIHKSHLEATADDATAVKALSATDEEATRRIESRLQNLSAVQATLAKLRAQSSAATRDWGARNARLAAEKDAVVREHVMLKAGLGSFRATQALRLKQLSVCSNMAQEQLAGKQATADRISKLLSMCRRLELDWDAAADRAVAAAGADTIDDSHLTDEAASSSPSAQSLNDQKAQLDEEAAELERQNQLLRRAVEAATAGMQVTDAVMADDSNPLLIVNDRLQRSLGVDVRRRPASAPVTQLLTLRQAQVA